MAYTVILEGGSPWGFRTQGGNDFKEPLRIAKLNPNSKAYNQGVQLGDELVSINGRPTSGLVRNEALQLIRNANYRLELELQKTEQGNRKRTAIPEIRINGPPLSNGNHFNDSDYYYSSCDEEQDIVRTNAIGTNSSSGSGHQSDGDNSGSTSGSQSSVVHVVGPYKGPLAEKMKNIANATNGPGPGVDSSGSPKTTVWAPFGQNRVKAYKPVSFQASSGATPGGILSSGVPSRGITSPLPHSQPATNINTTTFGNSSINYGSIAEPSRNSDITSNYENNNFSNASPSFSNFNGSSSVVVSSAPATAYTSIVMNSRKVSDPAPLAKYYGGPDQPSTPVMSNFAPQSPTKISGPQSPVKPFSPTGANHSPFAGSTQIPNQRPFSPTSPNAGPGQFGQSQAYGPVYSQTQAGTPSNNPQARPAPGSQYQPASHPPTQVNPNQPRPGTPTKSFFGPNSPIKPLKLINPPMQFRPPNMSKGPSSPTKGVISPTHASPMSPTRAQPMSPTRAQAMSPTRAQPMSPTRAQPMSPTRAQAMSPTRAQPMSPTRAQPMSPTRAQPMSPTKSNQASIGSFSGMTSPPPQNQPTSPTKTVTFGPVTSLGDTSNGESPEPLLSVSQAKSLFDQKSQVQPPTMQIGTQMSPQSYKGNFPVTNPSMRPYNKMRPFSPTRPFSPSVSSPYTAIPAANTMPPSSTTVETGNRPLTPRTTPQSPISSLKTPPPFVRPKSPTAKSKGLAMFLEKQDKYHDSDDQRGDFTDSEDVPDSEAKPVGPGRKQVPSSPIIGRAMPIQAESFGRVNQNTAEDIQLNNNSITSPESLKLSSSPSQEQAPAPRSVTSPSPKPGLWTPGQSAPDMEKDWQEKEQERLRDREAERALRNTPNIWQPAGPAELAKKEYKPVKLDSTKLLSPEKPKRSESASKISPEDSFAWKPSELPAVSSSFFTTTTTTMATTSSPSSISFSSQNGGVDHFPESKQGLPTYQSPTITLLQKSREVRKLREHQKELSEKVAAMTRPNVDLSEEIQALRVEENEVPSGAILVGSEEVVDGDKKHYDKYYLLPGETNGAKVQKVVERTTHKYKGIGPTDEATGVPIVPRGSVDEKEHKNWYKKMYKSLHKRDKKDGESEKAATDTEDSIAYHPTYVFPESESESERDDIGSTMSLDRTGYGKRAYTLPYAKYREEKYKNQPRSIENYEPGFSSLAFKEARVSPIPPPLQQKEIPKSPEPKRDKKPHMTPDKKSDKSYLYNPPIEKPGQFSRYVYSDTEPELKKRDRALSPQSDVETKAAYRRIQKGGDIPYEGLQYPITPKKEPSRNVQSNEPRQRHSVSGSGRSPTGSWDRQRRDEEAARRKQEMKRITAEEKLRRMDVEIKANEARRHNDFLTPSQKSPIPLNRYDDAAPEAPSLQRPARKSPTNFKGKAKALYNFNAQNNKEMSFKKNDIIYLVRQIDKNWYEGEHHGQVGIFPINYVEVLTSLDEARTAAMLREGESRAKFTFTAQSPMELSFRKGDTVSLIRRVDDNWFEGRARGKQGIFPVGYVEVMAEPDTPITTPLSSYAPTPATGSPGQLSPVSTISNGPAPTIPSAPISPRSSIDNFDFGQALSYGPSSAASTLSRTGKSAYDSDFGMDSLNMMRPASALGGPSDRYNSLSRDHYNPANRPSSAVPFDYYGKNSMRDSGFYGSEDSRQSRQQQELRRQQEQQKRQQELMRTLSNPYIERSPGRQSHGSSSQPYVSVSDEKQYPPYRALYNYRPQNVDELELREGDVVYVMEMCDDDWYVGTSERTGEFGTFPGNYVKHL